MSGHSKWATIKRKKAVTDAKKGAAFTKLSKNISVAAKNGKDPDMNPALRTAIDAARAENMPKDNIEKAILKGAGELPGVIIEEIVYEGYGPGGIALIIECVTDNTNRTVQFVRSTLTKAGGSLGSSGSVMYLFEQKGVIRLSNEDRGDLSVDDLEMIAIDHDAEDIQIEEEGITITTSREGFHGMVDVLQKAGITPTTAGIEWITPHHMDVDDKTKEKIVQLMETLEEDDDVNAVHTNAVL